MKKAVTVVCQLAFVLTGTIFRLPILGILWLLGKCGLIRTVFQVYPTDETETQAFCPNIATLRHYFSARPTFGGFITKGIRPIGIYVVIPDTAQTLVKRQNSHLSHAVVDRLHRTARLTGAQSIGLAGQLGYIFKKRHGISIDPPLYDSLYGSVFSLSETIFDVVSKYRLPVDTLNIGILGMGDIGQVLARRLENNGFRVTRLNLKLMKSGGIKLNNEAAAIPMLRSLHILVNITATGDYFLQTNTHQYISSDCIIIDFARPGIPDVVPNKLYMGNRVHRKGIHFAMSLPGDWDHQHIPACALASLLSTMTKSTWSDIDEFCSIAKQHKFFVPLHQKSASSARSVSGQFGVN